MVQRKSRKKDDVNLVVNQINIRAPYRSTQDIDKWRTAIRQFENETNPSRLRLYDLYSDIMLDGKIISTWGKRLDWVLNKKRIYIKADGKQDEEIEKLLNSPDMTRLIKELLNSILWGYTLIQVNNIWYDEMEERYHIEWDMIPRKHVHPEDNFQCVSKDQNIATKDWLYMEDPMQRYMLWAGDATDMGLLISAAQYVIYKRGDFGDWSQFAEMFGMPFRDATYSVHDEETRKALISAMEAWGGANYMVRPEGTNMQIHDNNGASGSNSLYKDLRDACNAEIAMIILGNTLTTEQGANGARSLGEVHQDAEAQKHLYDEKYILDILNTKYRAILKVFGINITGGAILFEEDSKDWTTLKTKWEVYSGIANKIPVSDDTIYEEFDIPKPDNYDQLKEEMDARSNITMLLQEKPLHTETKNTPRNILKSLAHFFE